MIQKSLILIMKLVIFWNVCTLTASLIGRCVYKCLKGGQCGAIKNHFQVLDVILDKYDI